MCSSRMASRLPRDAFQLSAEVDAAIAGLGAAGDQLVPSAAIRKLDAWLGRPAWLLDGSEISGEEPDLPEFLSLRDSVRIKGNLLIHLGFSDLAALLVRAIQAPTGRMAGLLTAFAPDLGAGVDAIVELTRLNNPHLIVESRVEGESRTVELRSNVDLGPASLVVALNLAVQMHRFLESRSAPTPGEVELSFVWTGPDDPDQVPGIPGAIFRFGRPADAVTYPRSWDRQRNPMHDPLLWNMALRMAREQGARMREAAVVSQVRRLVAEAIEAEQRPPSLRDVASSLGKSVRGLERNLTKSGATFRTIVEEERKRLAAAMLSDPSRTIQEISDLLGFSDRTSFTRSFRTWFNVPPAAFRLQHQDGGRLAF